MARRDTVTGGEVPPAPAAPIGERETLADLQAEAAGGAPAAGEGAPGQAAEGVAMAPIPEAPLPLVTACAGIVAAAGGVLAARLKVPPLSAEEADALGAAVAGVAVLYLPTDAVDPVTARWLALAGALMAVAVPRMGKEEKPARSVVVVPRAEPGQPMPPGPVL